VNLKDLNSDLHAWAIYNDRQKIENLGFNTMSSMGRCMEVARLGALINGTGKPQGLHIDEWVEVIDNALCKIDKIYSKVIKIQYCNKGDQIIKSKDAGCKDIRQYRYYLHCGKQELLKIIM